MNGISGFAAIDFEGKLAHVAGLGQTKQAAIKNAQKVSHIPEGSTLTTVPTTDLAMEAVDRLGGNAQDNKEVMLVLLTRAELKALALVRKIWQV